MGLKQSSTLRFVALFLLTGGFFIAAPRTFAAAIEQHVHIINQTYTGIGTSEPGDNSLGLIKWDDTKYNDATVYFEAMITCADCSGGNAKAIAALYSETGTAIGASVIETTNSGYTLVRSGDITSSLTTGVNYTVRISRDATAGTAGINMARLVIVQSAETITDTQSQIELGNSTQVTNEAYQVITGPKIVNYHSYYYSPEPSVYFEATLKSSESGGTAYAILSYSSDCSQTVSGSNVQTLGQTWQLTRSGSLSLTNDTNYFVCIRSSGSTVTTYIANAKLILEQSDVNGIESTLIHHLLVNTTTSSTNQDYTNQGAPLDFTPANFNGYLFNYFHEATIRSGYDNAYAELYNTSSSQSIGLSEISTSSQGYSRKRSRDLVMPTGTSRIYTRTKNPSGYEVAVSSNSLIIFAYQQQELTFKFEGVDSGTATNGVTVNTTSTSSKLDFGSIAANSPYYTAHKLTTSTTASGGYFVYVKLEDTLQGEYPANVIDSFPATWDNPVTWSRPSGFTPNINTGWIGANTSDGRISGWGNDAIGEFAGIGTTNVLVMASAGSDPGTSIYVTYALETNEHQPTDKYIGQLVYTLIPTY